VSQKARLRFTLCTQAFAGAHRLMNLFGVKARIDARRWISELRECAGRVSGLTRPLTSSIPALLAGFVVLGGKEVPFQIAMRAGCAIGLTAMAGFLFDNIYDLPADRMTGRPTPLTQGRVSIAQARGLAATLVVSALAMSPNGAAARLTIFTTLVALFFYSYFAHRVPWLKNMYSAMIVCVPLFYGAAIARAVVPLSYYFVLGFFTLGRETLIDVHQSDADRITRFRTLPILMGTHRAEIASTTIIMMTGLLLVWLTTGFAARAASVVSAATILVVLTIPLPAARRTGMLRIPMAIGGIAIGLSLFLR
jgi:4-hydroxybenzoate polyprenyltransferase